MTVNELILHLTATSLENGDKQVCMFTPGNCAYVPTETVRFIERLGQDSKIFIEPVWDDRT